MVNMRYGGKYWFHCEVCKKEADRGNHSIPPGWMHTLTNLKCGKRLKTVICEPCQDTLYDDAWIQVSNRLI